MEEHCKKKKKTLHFGVEGTMVRQGKCYKWSLTVSIPSARGKKKKEYNLKTDKAWLCSQSGLLLQVSGITGYFTAHLLLQPPCAK